MIKISDFYKKDFKQEIIETKPITASWIKGKCSIFFKMAIKNAMLESELDKMNSYFNPNMEIDISKEPVMEFSIETISELSLDEILDDSKAKNSYDLKTIRDIKEAYYLLKEFHLNQLKLATQAQTEALQVLDTKSIDKKIEFLKEKNLYVDMNHEYGEDVLFKRIRPSDFEEMFNALKKLDNSIEFINDTHSLDDTLKNLKKIAKEGIIKRVDMGIAL